MQVWGTIAESFGGEQYSSEKEEEGGESSFGSRGGGQF